MCSQYARSTWDNKIEADITRYASEVDVDFVRKAVRAVGQAAIKIESAAERCVSVLMELIETRVSYVVQEAVIVIKVSGCAGPRHGTLPVTYHAQALTIAGHLPEISPLLRGNHPGTLQQPGRAGRARGKGVSDLDHWRVCGKD